MRDVAAAWHRQHWSRVMAGCCQQSGGGRHRAQGDVQQGGWQTCWVPARLLPDPGASTVDRHDVGRRCPACPPCLCLRSGGTPLCNLDPAPGLGRCPCAPCRYGALKSLGEKKAAFHEYVQQRKKEEAEEARQRRMQVGGRRATARSVL